MDKNIKKGFTLIELLIVIAIIGILSSVILVSLTNSRRRSSGAAFKTTMSTLKGAVALCCTDSTNRLQQTIGNMICRNSANVYVGNSILPNATELSLGTGVATYNARAAYQCNTTVPTLRVFIDNDTKNPACSNGATGIWYNITSDKIYRGAFTTAPTAANMNFPAGC